MSLQTKRIYSFGPFRLDPGERVLSLDGRPISLADKDFETLLILVEKAGHLVDRDVLMNRLWPGVFVEEANIAKHVSLLRRVLSEATNGREYIETVPKRGYRMVVPVSEVADTAIEPQAHSRYNQNLLGRKVSHYRVLEILGGGGMGLVYKAEDLKLGRRVALKFLPEELANDPAALERFEREARAASALDHPNICTIHAVEEYEGKPFIVMQLLQGQTLREHIQDCAEKHSGLGIEQVLEWASQISRGLDAAHQAGIIHRDIKPANIFITNRDEVKLLDFGLAKLVDTGEFLEKEPGFQAPIGTGFLTSQVSNLTKTGKTMGTASYMSPEQVRGEPLDTRTDLFSFGLVLYEMATGTQAFPAETAAAVHEAILHRIPTFSIGAGPQLSPELERIISKALEKDRQKRYQKASELKDDLERLRLNTSSAATVVHSPIAVQVSTTGATGAKGQRMASRIARHPWWLAGGTSVLVILAITAVVLRIAPQTITGVPDLKQIQLTTNASENPIWSSAISPDGKYLAYSDLNGIHVKLIETGDVQNIDKPQNLGGSGVDWTVGPWFRDSNRFLAVANPPTPLPSSIWKVSVLGGTQQKIYDNATAWSISPDGTSILLTTKFDGMGDRQIWTIAPTGENAHQVYETDENSRLDRVQFSPDGRRIAYLQRRGNPVSQESAVESRDLTGGSPKVIVSDVGLKDFYWLDAERIIYSSGRPDINGFSCNIWVVEVTAARQVIGHPKRLTNWAGFCADSLSGTADGKRLGFQRWSVRQNVYTADFDSTRKHIRTPQPFTIGDARDLPVGWTPDNKGVVFSSNRNGRWQIFRQLLHEEKAQLIATGSGNADAPRISPDGNWVLYSRSSNPDSFTSSELMRTPVSGGPPQSISRTPVYDYRCAKSSSALCVMSKKTGNGMQLRFYVLDLVKGQGSEVSRFDTDPTARYNWDLSPDGNRVAIANSSEAEIHILSLNGGDERKVTIKDWKSLQSLNWAADGEGFFVGSPTQRSSALLYVDMDGNARTLWEQKGDNNDMGTFAVPSRDGHHLAISGYAVSNNVWAIENF